MAIRRFGPTIHRPYEVLLVDDHNILRDGSKAIPRHTEDFRVVGEVGDGALAVQLCRELKPDILLIGCQSARTQWRRNHAGDPAVPPDAKVIILSMYDDEHTVIGATRAGARAFRHQKGIDDDLLDAMRSLAKGGSYLSPQVSDRLLNPTRAVIQNPSSRCPLSVNCLPARHRCCA